MSFNIYLSKFVGAVGTKFPISIVESAFGQYAKERDPTRWVLTFEDGSGCEMYVRDGTEVTGFMIAGPSGPLAFSAALFEVLKQSSGVIFWPNGCVVADASVIPDLPP